ncbi:MAG: flagellar hook-associated protein 3 [Desulfurivibrio sp.]|nr:MAG: flagellar hook-associated protein 3 [Desulfurivibrio sp.]
MRTTLNTIYSMIGNNLNKITTDMWKLNSQISSGLQMSKISDNPVNMVSALGMRSTLAEISQYQSNITFGGSMIAASEEALTGIKELVTKTKEKTLAGINDSQTFTTRNYIADEIHVYLEQAVTLANTRWDGKYVFGGYRTTGYTATEPTPFMLGYIDGYRINGNSFAALDTMLSGTLGTTDLAAGDLLINGEDAGAVVLSAGTTAGLNMSGADNLKTAINGIAWPAGTTPVTATLTTLYAGAAETANSNPTDVSITINGVTINYTTSGANPAADAVDALNQYTDRTGVHAELGDNLNGGAAGTVVLTNAMTGDESDITITALTETANPAGPPAATSGLAAGVHSVGAGGNTGQISLQSTEAFELSSDNYTDDTVLDILGLGGGGVGSADAASDGILVYGNPLEANDLIINGIPVETITSDGVSDVFSFSSAEAKAAAINRISQDWVNASGETVAGTGVTAEVTPVFRQADGTVSAGTIGPGDLIINGIDIFAAAGPTAITAKDPDNVLLTAINAQQARTGIVATRNSDGQIGLKAIDGRNLHIQTTATGNSITWLNGASPTGAADRVYAGTIQLLSERTFMLESSLSTPYPPGGEEPGFAAIGLSGGALSTGEPADTAGDGKLSVLSIARLDNNVRYTGDRNNDAEIKVGTQSKIEIAKNGEEAIANTEIFKALKEVEDYLRGRNYTSVTGIHAQDDIQVTLDSLNDPNDPLEEKFQTGDFTITVTDYDAYPPLETEMRIPVDITLDTPATIAEKINGIPGLTSSWDSTGHLHIDSSDAGRYTFNITEDTSNTLNAFGINAHELQNQGLTKSLDDLDTVLSSLSTQISDFGARANRITIQSQIYANLKLANQENLSEKQDTDLTEALLNLKAKEVAYQAALNAAAKTMQLSLVDYL